MTGPQEQRRKKIRYRCWHRGTREMDLLLGRFADLHIWEMDSDDLDVFEALLAVPDPALYALIQSPKAAAEPKFTPVLIAIKSFHEGLHNA